MADQLYLSYWLRDFTGLNMLRQYEKLLRLFPFSRLSKQAAVFRIVPIDDRQPAVFERAYPTPPGLSDVLAAAGEFQHSDCCYRLEAAWDLWQFEDEWKLAPSSVTLVCLGPDFENETGEDLRMEFGVDANFLPQPGVPGEVRMVQSNIKSLLKLVHDVDDKLGAERRLLWTESGENFHDKLQRALTAGE
ncbi:MAG TPA: hypothetical protein VKG25_24935 [Bryobacteraceae bacterium]|nr:hypothetical protein [Bryobacteraceae bacterium]